MTLSASIRHMPIKPRSGLTARIALLLLPVLALPLMVLAQAPPPEVEQALRARVTEFLQYHVDGNFRKAYDMVAEDTKNSYFNNGKAQLTGFKIDDVKFTDNFTKAVVVATMSKILSFQGQDFPISMPSTITWKIEDGKWVWYNDVKNTWTTPMGPSADPPKANNQGGSELPKTFDDKTIAAAARSILQQVTVDKNEITLTADKTSEQKVVVHNGMPGSVQLELSAPEIPGFTVELQQSTVRAAGDAPVVFHYEPGAQPERREPIAVRVLVQPLNQTLVIRVNFAAPGPVVQK